MKQTMIELKRYVNKSRITVGDFSVTISTFDRTSRQKISKDRENVNNTIIQLN